MTLTLRMRMGFLAAVMSRAEPSIAHSPRPIGPRLVAFIALLAFMIATVVHFPHMATGQMSPPTVAAGTLDDDGSADGTLLSAEHCDCVVAATWLNQAVSAHRLSVHGVPASLVHDLATRHPENDAPPPKA